MFNNILYELKVIWDTYVTSYEGIATGVIILVMLLKVLINQKASSLSFKKMFVSFPSEVVFLVIGFLFADLISSNTTKADKNGLVASIVIALILLVIQYAIERWLEDKLSGKLKKGISATIFSMYVVSIIFYICVVWL